MIVFPRADFSRGRHFNVTPAATAGACRRRQRHANQPDPVTMTWTNNPRRAGRAGQAPRFPGDEEACVLSPKHRPRTHAAAAGR